MKSTMSVLAAAALLAACAAATPTRETQQAYAVYDVKGDNLNPGRVAEAVKTALQKNMSAVQITQGIPPSPLPEKAPRFQLTNPFKGSSLAALAQAQGQSMMIPTCEGAIVSARGQDTSMSRYGEATTFFACVMPYQGGYSLNIYTTFSKASGAFSAETIAATMMRPLVGDSSQFIPRTIKNVVENLQGVGATVTLKEAYPS